MNGSRLLLDTNALIGYLQGNTALQLVVAASEILIPIIAIIEFLAFSQITEKDKELLYDFVAELKIIDLKKDDISLIELISNIRSSCNIKLPDSIIAAMAIYNKAILVTNDKNLSKVSNLSILTF